MQNIKAIIDIGSGWIKVLVIGEEDGKRITLHKSKMITNGIRKGKILEPDKLKDRIVTITNDINKKIGGENIDEYIISISHPKATYKRIQEQKRIIREKIINEDIKNLSATVADIANDSNQELLKLIPTQWIVDGTEITKNPPQGASAKKLDMVADTFYIPRGFYEQLFEIIESIDIYVADIIPNVLATTESTVDYESADLGCITIDIGKEQTSFIIHEDGYPIRYETLPIGGDAVTRDISICMQTDIREAENMKIQQGSLGDVSDEKKDQTTIDIHLLNQIIKARYREILEIINDRLIELGKDGRLAGGAIFSGGGSQIPHLTEYAKDIFQLVTSIGKDTHLTTKETEKETHFVNTLGAYNRSEKYSHERRSIISTIQFNADVLGKIKNFFQKLF